MAKARSLGSALLIFTAVPWLLCAIFFSGLHWTYPRDKRKAVELRLAAVEDLERVALTGAVRWRSEGGGGGGDGEGGGTEGGQAWPVH